MSTEDPTVDDMVNSLKDYRALRAWLAATEARYPNGEKRCLETSHETLSDLLGEIDRLRAELSAARGYLMNAKIDLETGAPKKTVIATIEGGLKRIDTILGKTE